MSIKKNAVSHSLTSTGEVSKNKAVAIVAVLIAIGAVLRMFSPNILGITPNFVIAMYCLSIILLRPKLKGALGIGLVAGAVSMIFSKSPMPALNLITEPVGAVVCLLVVKYLPEIKLYKMSLMPVTAVFIGTVSSGTLYVILNFLLVLKLPLEAMMAALVGVVLPVALINSVMSQLLYTPVRKLMDFDV
ncbi:MAG: hypothetical protein H0Z40_10680 [Desulfotomaculum sp.]|nr:hypothetical protein [Desulfotomaculum sp.]